jgi:hypothetical protein
MKIIPLMNKDYGRHVRRTWVDTHSQSIRTDPEIYLPGEIAAKDEDGDSDTTTTTTRTMRTTADETVN